MSTSSKHPHRTSPTSCGWRTDTAGADAVVALGLGSNIGDRFYHLARALEALRSRIGPLTALSSIYLTEPVGYRDQPDFWNVAALFQTALEPVRVFEQAKEIERELGRDTPFAGGPRNIDIDVLLYGDVVVSIPQLEIPHPRLHKRAFVLRPLAEIAPDMQHPQLRENIATLQGRVSTQHAAPLAAESARLRERLAVVQERI